MDCRDAIDELRETESQLYQQRFDNVVSEYDGILGIIEHEKNMLEEFINQSETNAWITSTKYYEALAANEKKTIAELQNEKSGLLAELENAMNSGTIDKYSESWYDMCQQIDDVTLSIEQGETALLEYAKAIREIKWEIFDLLQDKISQVTTESDFLIDLLENSVLYDDRGQLTDEGMSTMGLHGLNYNVYMAQADEYAKEIQRVNKELANDPYNQDIAKRRQELLELQQESILAAEDEKNAIRDMVEEGINLELEALQELIDSYSDALDAQKDLYDYQKKVQEQTEEIASLEKQMAAYAGDDSEESRKRIQEIKVELENARDDLQETEYDQYISDQKQLLDELYTEYETILNARLDNIDALISDMILQINSSADIINSTLLQASSDVGYIMSEEMRNIWGLAAQQMQVDAASRVNETNRLINQLVANGTLAREDANKIIAALGNGNAQGITNATNIINQLVEQGKLSQTDAQTIKNTITTTGTEYKGVITTYGTDFQNKATTTNTVLNGIKADVSAMVQKLNATATTKTKTASTSSAAKSTQASTSTSKSTSTTTTKKSSSGGDGVPRVGDKVKYESGSYYYDSYGSRPLGYHNRGGYVYITHINSKGTHPYHISTGNKLGKGDLGWLKLSQLSGYATGKHKFSSDEIAWTQEGGQEFIVRPSDGAILTPLAKGDSVLNANASQNIWDMANTPSDFIKDNLNLGGVDASAERSVQNTYTQSIDNVVFSLPNVKNYDELLSTMQRDKNFERLINAMTFDQMAGKSSLAKGKAIR